MAKRLTGSGRRLIQQPLVFFRASEWTTWHTFPGHSHHRDSRIPREGGETELCRAISSACDIVFGDREKYYSHDSTYTPTWQYVPFGTCSLRNLRWRWGLVCPGPTTAYCKAVLLTVAWWSRFKNQEASRSQLTASAEQRISDRSQDAKRRFHISPLLLLRGSGCEVL